MVTVETDLLWVFSLVALMAHHNRLELFLHIFYADIDGTCIDLFLEVACLVLFCLVCWEHQNKVGTAQ